MIALHQLQGADRPGGPESSRQRLQNAALLRCRKFRQDHDEPGFLVGDQFG
jgi:hypothetical protein